MFCVSTGRSVTEGVCFQSLPPLSLSLHDGRSFLRRKSNIVLTYAVRHFDRLAQKDGSGRKFRPKANIVQHRKDVTECVCVCGLRFGLEKHLKMAAPGSAMDADLQSLLNSFRTTTLSLATLQLARSRTCLK